MREWQSLSHERWYCRYPGGPRPPVPEHPAEVHRGAYGRVPEGKSAIRIHGEFLGRDRNFTGFHFWARGYCVSTVGLDEQLIREYIRNQEDEEKREEQAHPWGASAPFVAEQGAVAPFMSPTGA